MDDAQPELTQRSADGLSTNIPGGPIVDAALCAAAERSVEEDRRAREANAAYRRGGAAKPRQPGPTGQLLDLNA